MSGLNSKHSYDAIFNQGMLVEGKIACPACGSSALHPTGHTMTLRNDREYAPDASVVAWCECGQAVAIELGNFKGHLGIDVVAITPAAPR